MAEAEWLACNDPEPMLYAAEGRVSDRKLRLFACECCRPLLGKLSIPAIDLSEMLRTAERFAEGLIPEEEFARHFHYDMAFNAPECIYDLDVAGQNAFESFNSLRWLRSDEDHTHESEFASHEEFLRNAPRPWRDGEYAVQRASSCMLVMSHALTMHDLEAWKTPNGVTTSFHVRAAEFRSWFADILREVAGNPFRPVAVDPAWLTPTVTSLAAGIYADRAFDRMPVLADALEEAGCDNNDVLTHCREPGEHVRGCWVVDLLLGKQ